MNVLGRPFNLDNNFHLILKTSVVSFIIRQNYTGKIVWKKKLSDDSFIIRCFFLLLSSAVVMCTREGKREEKLTTCVECSLRSNLGQVFPLRNNVTDYGGLVFPRWRRRWFHFHSTRSWVTAIWMRRILGDTPETISYNTTGLTWPGVTHMSSATPSTVQ